jgi:hypothetical protein
VSKTRNLKEKGEINKHLLLMLLLLQPEMKK